MGALDAVLERRLAGLSLPLAIRLPGGQRLGPDHAAVTLRLQQLGTLAHLATGNVGRVGEDYVEDRLDFDGSVRDLMAIAGQLAGDPRAAAAPSAALAWWQALWRPLRSRLKHDADADARQVQFHYDVSDDFYSLWLDPRRVYSCAYYRERTMTLAQAQEAKLDHICRKLMLRDGERFLDVGAGWVGARDHSWGIGDTGTGNHPDQGAPPPGTDVFAGATLANQVATVASACARAARPARWTNTGAQVRSSGRCCCSW
mgnify:CR=1 FL=1